MIGDLRDYTEELTRYARGYITHGHRPARVAVEAERPGQRPSSHGDVPERNLHRLAAQLEEAAAHYLAVAETVDDGQLRS